MQRCTTSAGCRDINYNISSVNLAPSPQSQPAPAKGWAWRPTRRGQHRVGIVKESQGCGPVIVDLASPQSSRRSIGTFTLPALSRWRRLPRLLCSVHYFCSFLGFERTAASSSHFLELEKIYRYLWAISQRPVPHQEIFFIFYNIMVATVL